MQREAPLVSVLMTAFNRQNFIEEAIESVLSSTYTNFELIVVDDCSTDNTVAVAQKYAERDKRIKLFVNNKNGCVFFIKSLLPFIALVLNVSQFYFLLYL